jgi:hypothetical protein
MNFILTYLFLGTITMVALELSVDYIENTLKVQDIRREMGVGGRIIGILIWPVGLIIFLTALIKTHFKK